MEKDILELFIQNISIYSNFFSKFEKGFENFCCKYLYLK